MARIPLGTSSSDRQASKRPEIKVVNRFFESDPTNMTDQVALLSRPALKYWLEVGDGPIRCVYSQPGAFQDALFVVSGNELYRIDVDESITLIGDGIDGPSLLNSVSMAATDTHLFIADGIILWVYDGTTLSQVPTPDDVGINSVGHIASFIICVVSQGFNMDGRFYWINPDETTIDPLNFATAERSPDPAWSVNVVGDAFWLPGTKTTEIWYPSGDAEAPFIRQQGRLFDRGVWQGTAVQVKDTVILVDTDGVVYSIGAGPERISNPGIEERIRRAMTQARSGL